MRFIIFVLILLFSCKSKGQGISEKVLSPVSKSSDLFDLEPFYDQLADSLLQIKADSFVLKSQFSPSNPWAGKFDTVLYYNGPELLYVWQGSPYQDSIKFRSFYVKNQLFKVQIFKLENGHWIEDGREYHNQKNWIGVYNTEIESELIIWESMKEHSQRFKSLNSRKK